MPAEAVLRKGGWRVALVCLAVFLLSAGLRLIEFRNWDRAQYRVDGELLLATHDAYFWVAGAEGRNTVARPMPMAVLLDVQSRVFPDVPLANLAFWDSAFLAALVAIPIALWCFQLEAPAAALLAPLLVTLAPSFYTRTRLGFYDTDWAALFFPLLISWLVARWLVPRLRTSMSENGAGELEKRPLTVPILLVLLTAAGVPWHNFVGLYLLAMLGLAGALVLILGKSEARPGSLLTLLAIALPVGAGWIGAGLGLLLIWGTRCSSALRHGRWATRITAAALAVTLAAVAGSQFREYLAEAVENYAAGLGGGSGAGAPTLELQYPGTSVSVRETQDVNPWQIMEGTAIHPVAGVLGILGFFYLVWKRPEAITLLPLLALGLAALRIGIRFTMFGAPIALIGLLVPLDWMIAKVGERQGWTGWRKGLLAPGAAALLIPLVYLPYMRLPADPVLEQEHARALIELGELADPGAEVWTWWDYGYATQHFSGLETFADGRRNSGEYLFSLGTALGAEDLRRSAAFMRFAARHDEVPWETWVTWSEAEFETWLASLGAGTAAGDPAPSPQYLVVQWEGIASLPWIQYYGSWDFDALAGQRSRVVRVTRPQSLDLEAGEFLFDGEGLLNVYSVDILAAAGRQHYDYPGNGGGPYLLLNDETGEVMLLDQTAYQSTFVRLLITPAEQLEDLPGFKLVIDRQPGVRVYALR